MKNKMIVVYSTFSSYEEFEKIAEILVSERLVACANSIENVKSVYMWQDELKKETEVCGLFKSTKVNYKAIRDRITELHSYENPCIFRFCVKKPAKTYFKWLSDTVAG
jgi:periplasmic divalent cation tolerance protein